MKPLVVFILWTHCSLLAQSSRLSTDRAESPAPAAFTNDHSTGGIARVEFVIRTNYLTAHPDFRRVNGQLYNVRQSTNWWNFTANVFALAGTVVICDKVFLTPINTNALPGKDAASLTRYLGETRRIALTNFADHARVVVGKHIKGRAMRTGRFTYYADAPDELWDCGNPNIVPVLVTNRVTKP